MARRLTLDFLKTETASGAALGLAAIAALVVANSPLSDAYFGWLKTSFGVQAGPFSLAMTASDWVKEGLMAVFFLVVGLEIKYEILKGELSDPRNLVTPAVAALGGMLAPACVYLAIALPLGGPAAGWPIPLATDIAFALAVFAVVGRELPASLRVFLLTLAIVDDLGAILLIAVLFSQGVDLLFVALGAGVLAALALLARRKLPTLVWVTGFAAVWWISVQASLSTSLAAVAFAAIVPINPRTTIGESPLKAAMHAVHPYVAFLVLPIFAFAKAGVSFAGVTLEQLGAPLVVGVAAGLFVGKQIGVLGAAWLTSALGLGTLPRQTTWLQLYGVSLLCGVGFTMSLFVGALAFPGAMDSLAQVQVKLGVIGGSLMSAACGGAVLMLCARRDLRSTPRP